MNIAVKAAFGCGAVAVLIGMMSGGGVNSSTTAAPNLPNDQTQFIEAVIAARATYSSAPNELAAGGVRSARRSAICNVLTSQNADDWYGKVTSLSSNGDGKGVITLAVGPNVSVSTWNNALSDLGDHTLIEPTSAVFRSLATLKIGDRVKFSGQFLSSDVDCVREKSITIRGSMKNPDFLMTFSTVQKAL